MKKLLLALLFIPTAVFGGGVTTGGTVGGGGSGTVTSASVTAANGVSATVANPTTTPAFTFTLGAITPSSVAIGTTLVNPSANSETIQNALGVGTESTVGKFDGIGQGGNYPPTPATGQGRSILDVAGHFTSAATDDKSTAAICADMAVAFDSAHNIFGLTTELAVPTSYTGHTQGLYAVYGENDHSGTGTLSFSYGVFGASYNVGAGTITNSYAGFFDGVNGTITGGVAGTNTGIIGENDGVAIRTGALTGTTVTNNFGLHIQSPVTGGTFTNGNIGILLDDQSLGTGQYAIKTLGGAIQFGGPSSTITVLSSGTGNVTLRQPTAALGATINLDWPIVTGRLALSAAAVSNQWIDSISTTTGAPHLSQPAFSNLSGNIATSQMNSGTSASSTTFWRGDGTWAAPSAGTGTVTSFSAGNLSPLFTSSVATATTTPALTFSLSTAGAHNFLGNNTGSTAAPAYVQPAFSDLSGTATGAQLPVFVASGASHAAGAVPDPGSTAGTTKFLREDATFAVPSGSGTGTVNSGTAAQVAYYASTGTAVSGDTGLTYDATNKAITLGGGTVTASTPVLNLTQTWNASGTTFTGILENVTNTASATASKLLDLQLGGSSVFYVDKSGNINVGSSGNVTINGGTKGLRLSSTNGNAGIRLAGNGTNYFVLGPVTNTTAALGYNSGDTGATFTSVLSWSDSPSVTVSGALIATPQALSGSGAIDLVTITTAFTSTAAANALTLANGTNGQIKTIVHVSKGTAGTGVLTPTTANGFTTITLTNAGDSVTLQYFTTGGWAVIASRGATIA